MADNNYDDLLESFMNNSRKAYNEDKDTVKRAGEGLPSSYNTFSKNKKKKAKKPVKKAPQKKSKKPLSTIGKIIVGFILVCLIVGVICSSVVFAYGVSVVNGDVIFNLEEEATGQNQTSIIYGYDKNNKLKEITRLHGEENRIWLDLDDMNDNLEKAFIAMEDQNFEKHHGVNWVRTIGVMIKPEYRGQGGSTITQQLIKNLTDENDVTFVRKFNEILSALNIEKHYSKDQIMEAYLNTIYLSHGCYGAKTAAEKYFGKEVKDLDLAECACLASITQFPTRYDPLLHPDKNKERANRILDNMLEQGFIDQEQHDKAVNEKLIYTNSPEYKGSSLTSDKDNKKEKEDINSYYTDYVIQQVIDDLQSAGYSSKKAKNMIYGGGLKIYSAIDFDVQDSIEDVYENYRKMPDETVQGACVVMDYKGRILGLVGGTGEKKANRVFNRATQAKRQPGSTIKPLSVYGPAFEKSLQDDDVNIFWSTPTADKPLTKIDGKPWPTNEGGTYSGGVVTVQRGLAKSMNTISAQTIDKIGTTYSYDFVTNRFHLSTLTPQDCDLAPLATGSMTYGVTVLEMTTAYQAFGNGGYYYEGYSYYKIEDSKGNIVIEKNPEKDREIALSEGTAWVMNKMMQTVMTQGTGTSYKLNRVQCIGKTGTTTGSNDRWFIGGTPEYMCGVWYGYDKNKEVVYRLSANPAGTLWNLVMKNIYETKNDVIKEFPDYDGIVHKQYGSDGTLQSGSGNWGWFDKNNLPTKGTGSGLHISSGFKKKEESSTSKKEDETDSSNSTTKNEETSKPETTKSQVTESANSDTDEEE